MPKYNSVARVAPPFVVLAVALCLLYALQGHGGTAKRPSTRPAARDRAVARQTSGAVADAALQSNPSPTVHKLGRQLQFSVDTAAYQHVQKVEYYVERQLVGAAYAQPYQVAVSENALSAGEHSVVAKIYTGTTTAESAPASFRTQPVLSAAPPAETADDTSSGAATTPVTPSAPTAPATPTNATATPGADGTSVSLSWTAVSGASQYHIWRDGMLVATTNETSYTDSGLTPGQTYEYSLTSSNADATSAASAPLAVTTPTPRPTTPVNTDGASSDTPAITNQAKPDTVAPTEQAQPTT